MIYSREEAAALVLRAGLELVEKGLIARTWGNISARISETEFLITPSGMAYERLTAEDLVVCRIEDCGYEGEVKPSSEKGVHAAAYRHRPDIGFVIHTHQLCATAVGAMGKGLSGEVIEKSGLPGGRVVCGRYAISSTKPLAKNMEDAILRFPECKNFFMRYHGALCLGADYDEAFLGAEKLEEICRRLLTRKLRIDMGAAEGFPEQLDEQLVQEAVAQTRGEVSMIFDRSQPAVEVSWKWDKLYPMIDDMAQIAGVSVACIEPGAGLARRIAEALTDRDCVLIRGLGAVCIGPDVEETEALRIVLDKNCLAALYCDAHSRRDHLALPDAMLQRFIYKTKYSKLK